ncbi:cytoplasmic protein [Nocardia sp. NPDC005998]|uniref:cytoplasmic protein n=1 Tax=Nocardia sp. NPDC005998 TaxID=3156894 RepID=UPI0033B81740
MSADPIAVNPELYRVIFENERVRVLEYRDEPGDRTQPHHHPDSVLYPLTSFRRRISANGQQVEVALTVGQVRWVGAQEHAGENIGDTETHALFIELKEPPPTRTPAALGPSTR